MLCWSISISSLCVQSIQLFRERKEAALRRHNPFNARPAPRVSRSIRYKAFRAQGKSGRPDCWLGHTAQVRLFRQVSQVRPVRLPVRAHCTLHRLGYSGRSVMSGQSDCWLGHTAHCSAQVRLFRQVSQVRPVRLLVRAHCTG